MRRFFRKKAVKLSKEAYGEVILSRFILTSGNRFFELSQDLDLNEENQSYSYFCFLQYLLYLSQKILEQKYPISDVSITIDSAINGIVDLLDSVKLDDKSEVKTLMKNHYLDFLVEESINIFEEIGMHELVNLFEENLEIEHSFQSHFRIFTEFTLFIKYHAGDILNDKIELV